MAVDNFDKIVPLLKFDRDGDYYFLEIIKRAKDGHKRCNGDNHARLIKDFCIDSAPEQYRKKVMKLCVNNLTGACIGALLVCSLFATICACTGVYSGAVASAVVFVLFVLCGFVDAMHTYSKRVSMPNKNNIMVMLDSNEVELSNSLKEYGLYSMESLERHHDEIIDLCNKFHARAYIRLNRRNYTSTSMNLAEEIIRKVRKGDTMANPYKMVSSIMGRTPDEPYKTWLVDIDAIDGSNDSVDSIAKKAAELVNECAPDGNKIVATIPSKSGIHLITRPFNRQQFTEKCNRIGYHFDVHLDNPTILYASDDETV